MPSMLRLMADEYATRVRRVNKSHDWRMVLSMLGVCMCCMCMCVFVEAFLA